MGRTMAVLVAITVGLLVGERGGVAVFADEPKAPQALPEVLTLDKAVELALSNHPSLRVASGTQAINEALVGQAQAGFYPQVQGTISKTLSTTTTTIQLRDSTTGPGRQTNGITTGFNTGSVTLNQSLYDIGTTKSQVETARFTLQAANCTVVSASQLVVVN